MSPHTLRFHCFIKSSEAYRASAGTWLRGPHVWFLPRWLGWSVPGWNIHSQPTSPHECFNHPLSTVICFLRENMKCFLWIHRSYTNLREFPASQEGRVKVCTRITAPHGLPWWLNGEESASYAGDRGSIPGSGRSPGGGHGNPLQYSGLENPMDRGAWWATVHGVAKRRTGLTD